MYSFLLHDYVVEDDEPGQVELGVKRLDAFTEFYLDHLVKLLRWRLFPPGLAFWTVGVPHLLDE